MVKACESILKHARQNGRSDANLEKRIARRLFIHVWEFGANGQPKDRKDTIERIACVLSNEKLLKFLVKVYGKLPVAMDKLPLALIHKLQNRN